MPLLSQCLISYHILHLAKITTYKYFQAFQKVLEVPNAAESPAQSMDLERY